MKSLSFLLPALLLLSHAPVNAAVDFVKDIQPIFEDRCIDCHDGETKKGGVSLDSFHGSRQPADSGEPLTRAGDAAHSLLLHVITEQDPKKRMPPKGKPLTEEQISTLRQWIAEGAVWPDDGWRPKKHWAYVPPELPTVPLKAGNARNEIDAFIDVQLSAKKLQRSPA